MERSIAFEIVQIEIPNTKTKLHWGFLFSSIQTPQTCTLHLDLQMQLTEGVI